MQCIWRDASLDAVLYDRAEARVGNHVTRGEMSDQIVTICVLRRDLRAIHRLNCRLFQNFSSIPYELSNF